MLPWIVILAFVGLAFVIAEFLIPGFGVFGVLGMIALFLSTILIAFEYGTVAFLVTVLILIAFVVALVLIMKKKKLYAKFILTEKQEAQDFDESTIQNLKDQQGIVQTPLKPYGKAEFNGKLVEVFSDGEFIEKGKKVKVIQISGKNVTVREIES